MRSTTGIVHARARVGRAAIALTIASAAAVVLPGAPASAAPSSGGFTAASAASAKAVGDFNNDGYDDLAIGVPSEDIDGQRDAGVVHVMFGGPRGVHPRGNTIVYQNTPFIEGNAEAGDQFGAAVTAGDVDGDNFDDLIVGVPGEDIGNITDAGVINVIRGSEEGLTAASDRMYSQASEAFGETNEKDDRFGSVLATGDFDRNGVDDLAVGIPDEDVLVPGMLPIGGGTNTPNAGLVIVAHGTKGTGLAVGSMWDDSTADAIEADDRFGAALGVGDFDNNDHDDLAIGAPLENAFELPDVGAVTVLYGQPAGGIPIISETPAGLSDANAEYWTEESENVAGAASAGDFFGFSLATGDFNNDGHDDLAVGLPGENVGPPAQSRVNGGAVTPLRGTGSGPGDPGGLTGVPNTQFTQDTPGIEGASETDDFYGIAVAAGDVNGDGYDDLIVGIPFEDVGTIADAGMINILFGDGSGISTNDRIIHQDSHLIKGGAEADDSFGASLATGDYNSTVGGVADIAVGVPLEDLPGGADAGAVQVIHGAAGSGPTTDDEMWFQGAPGMGGMPEFGDQFGYSTG